MKCPKRGTELKIGMDWMDWDIYCPNPKCHAEITPPDVEKIFLESEKNKAELSLIKSRLQGITVEQIVDIIAVYDPTRTFEDCATEIHKIISEVMK